MSQQRALLNRVTGSTVGPVPSVAGLSDTFVVPVLLAGDPALSTTPFTLQTSSGSTSFYVVAASPEGVLTAATGAYALNALSGAFYSKASGIGPTGWVESLTGPTGSVAIVQGGNALGAPITIGSTDAFSLSLRANGITGVSIDTAGGLSIQKSLSTTAIAVADKPTGGAIGTAATTVDVGAFFTVAQSTSGQTLALPTPTSTTAGRLVVVENTGSTSFTLLGRTLAAGNGLLAAWTGASWSLVGTPTGGASTTALSSITAATSTSSQDSLNFSQVWDWSTATNEIPLMLRANSLTAGNILNLFSSSTGAFSATGGLLKIYATGTHTGSASTVSTGTLSGSALSLYADALTTGTGLLLSVDALTTGTGISIDSTATGTTGKLLSVSSSSTGTPATGLVDFSFAGHGGTGLLVSDSTATGRAARIQANSLSSGTGLSLLSTSTAAAGNSQTLLDVDLSGANATAGQATTGVRVANTHTGAGTNVGLTASASGGTNNYGLLVPAGRLGLGTSAPSELLHVSTGAAATTAVLALETSAGAAREYVGTGTPEGVVTGSAGDQYRDVTPGAGKLFIKNTGTSTNTGWLQASTGGSSSVFTGATSGAAGSTGIVPAPTAGQQAAVLYGNSTWGLPSWIVNPVDNTDAGPTLVDVDPGNYSVLRFAGGGLTTNITGISGGTDGRVLTLVNASGTYLTIPALSGSSSANAQVATVNNADIPFPPEAAITLIYDGVAAKWRAPSSAAFQYANTPVSVIADGSGVFTGGANQTIDRKNYFSVQQTTAGQTRTFPTPTSSVLGREVTVENGGSVPFLMYDTVIPVDKAARFLYAGGTTWVCVGAPQVTILTRVQLSSTSITTSGVQVGIAATLRNIGAGSTVTTGASGSITIGLPGYYSLRANVATNGLVSMTYEIQVNGTTNATFVTGDNTTGSSAVGSTGFTEMLKLMANGDDVTLFGTSSNGSHAVSNASNESWLEVVWIGPA